VFQVDWYLASEEPLGRPLTAAEYYAQAEGLTDPRSLLNETIVAEAQDAASCGTHELHEACLSALTRLSDVLKTVPPDQAIVVSRRRTLLLDEYLRTRIVEMTIHTDDLAASVDRLSPELPEEAYETAVSVLMDSAVMRHGAPAVLQAIARPDSQLPSALRVV
jgi:hypothetical protein